MKTSLMVVCVGILVWTTTFGESIPGGLYVGNTYRELPDDSRRAYISGVIDGFFFAPVWGGSSEKVFALLSCIKEMTNQQLMAIVDRYLADHPSDWHLPMHDVTFTALGDVCPDIAKE